MRVSILGILGSFLYLAFTLRVAAQSHEGQQKPFAFRHSNNAHATKHIITPECSRFVEDLLEIANIPGLTLGIVHTDREAERLVELDAWGRKTEEGFGHDMSPDTLFAIASCSKAFMATSLGLLMDDYANGRNVTPLPRSVAQFDWDTKVRDLLPDDWKLEDEWASEKTNIRDMLGHVTGMPRHDYSYQPGDTPQGVVRNLRNLRPGYELRKKWSYNNQMYIVGAHLIATYANMSYPEFALSRIFEPLGMASTTFSPDVAQRSGKRTQTWTKFGRRISFWFTEEIAHLKAGPGGIISSAKDLTKWVTVLLNAGVEPVSNTTIIPRSVFDEMTTAHSVVYGSSPAPDSSLIGYGMGWDRWSYRGHEIVAHTGGLPGISTLVALLPDDGLGLVALANADEKAAAERILMERILDDMIDFPEGSRATFVDAERYTKLELGGSTSKEVRGAALCSSAGSAPSPAELEPYAGTYGNEGYGAITLCAPSSDSFYCNDVFGDFAPFRPDPAVSSPMLLAAYPRVWTTHVRMIPCDGETFDLGFTALFPHGYGRNTSAFETFETGDAEGQAVFVVEEKNGKKTVKGFGLLIDQDAVAERKRMIGTSVEQYADAWFEKV